MDEAEREELDERASAADSAEDLAWVSLEIGRAQRQIARGLSELAEGIVSLSLALLDVRQRRLYRFDPDCPTFEGYVAQRHGISADQAHLYVTALMSLGEAQYRALLSDLGLQRTYALALLNRADPALVAAFQQLPDAERRAVTVAQITAVDTAVTADLGTRVAQLEQEITRAQGLHQQTRRRLHEVEELHQRVTSDLIEERDSARQALDQEQQQTERLRALLSEARRATGRAEVPVPPTSPPAAEAVAEAVVVVACDVASLLIDARGLTEKLERLGQIDPAALPAEQRRDLALALQALGRAIAALLG